MFLEIAVEYLWNGECQSFQTFAIVFYTHENLLVEIYGALWMKTKPLSRQKHVLRKSCGVSQKDWVLEFSNLCHCVLHPWYHTSRDFWSSMNERNLLSWLKYDLGKYSGVSQKWWMTSSFQTFATVFCTPENLLVRDYWNSRNERKPFSELNHVLRKCSRVSQKQWVPEFSNLCHCVQHP